MTTKTKTPQALREQAESLARQAAEAQAEVDAHTLREWEQEQEELRKADQKLVDDFDSAALDQDVDDAWQALKQAVSAQPTTQALADYLGVQYVRNHAHGDLAQARARLGLSSTGGRRSSTTEIAGLDELVVSTAQRDAQRHVDAYRSEQQS